MTLAAATCEKCHGTRRVRVEVPWDELDIDEPTYFMARCDQCDLWGYLDRDGLRRCGACTLQGLPGRQHPNAPHGLTGLITTSPSCECSCTQKTQKAGQE